MNPVDLLSSGGIGAGAFGVLYAMRLFFDYRKHRHDTDLEDQHLFTQDSATANAILRDTLTSVQTENQRLVTRVDALESEASERERLVDKLRSTVGDLQTQLTAIASELDRLKDTHSSN